MKKILGTFFLGLITFLILWTQPDIKQFGTIKIWDRNNILLYELAGTVGRKMPITYEQLPEYLIDAAVASEDESFWINCGVDFKAIVRSLALNIQKRKIITGASTITQQLVRTSIISPQKIPTRSINRKIREIVIALRLNIAYSKKDILTMYFNQMYFGNLAYGIGAAARTYFTKDVSQLSLAESAFLVGLLSSPDKRNPFTNMQEAKDSQIYVLDLMEKNGFISKEKAEVAKKEELTLVQKKEDIKAPHFVQYVLEDLAKMGIKTKQGININTTFDYPTFLLSEDIAKLWVNKLRYQHYLTNVSMIVLKNNSGEILSLLGGVDYYDATHSGQVNMTTALRQPGSSIKPLTYAAAFMQGYTPATLIYDVRKVYQTKKGEGFTPNNYDGRYHGLVLAREALASSLNLPAVEMLNRVGINNFLKIARDLGITTFTQDDRYDLALTLGGGEVKLLELTNAFATFARGGEFKTYYMIQKIVTDDGEILYSHKELPSLWVLGKTGKQIAYLITHILSDSKARIPGFGEKNPLVLSHPAAVKTGTTTDWHDNWTIGYTPSYTVGVWVGNNDNQPMREITGVTGAAPIWNQFFEEFLKGKPKEKFTRPPGIVETEICKLSGKLPDGICPEKMTEIFLEGTQPKEKSNLHKKINIDKRNNLLAGESCLKEAIIEKVFIDYPAEVYSWVVESNQEVIPQQYSPLCIGSQRSSEKTYLEITYPRKKSVFETAPLLVNNQAIVFEVNVSPDINKVLWYVNNVLIKEVTSFPFSASWRLQVGKHLIKAVGITSTGKTVESGEVNISVIEFKGDT